MYQGSGSGICDHVLALSKVSLSHWVTELLEHKDFALSNSRMLISVFHFCVNYFCMLFSRVLKSLFKMEE